MIYYIRKLKVAVDFESKTFVCCAKCPEGATVPVDFLTVDPANTVTRAEAITVHMRPAVVLHLNAFDMVTVATILGALGMLKPRPSRRFYSLFHGNPMEGFRNVCRTALDLPAPGECSAWKAVQLASRPADWQALRETATGGAADGMGPFRVRR